MDELGIKNLIFTSTVAIYGLNKLNPDEDLHQILLIIMEKVNGKLKN